MRVDAPQDLFVIPVQITYVMLDAMVLVLIERMSSLALAVPYPISHDV
jgi:hypothetical protein